MFESDSDSAQVLRMNSDAQEQQECNSSTPQNALEFQELEEKVDSALTIKLPSSLQEFNNGDKEDDEPRTPTSSDHRIPVSTTCPPAPRKPKTVPRVIKRKTPSFQRISVNLLVAINAMFPPDAVVAVPDIPARDLAAGDHIKKVKTANVTTGS